VEIATFETFADAYTSSLLALLERGEPVPGVRDPSSIGSDFGLANRETLELRPFGFRIADPHACLIQCRARQPSLSFALGQWLWAMRGSNDVESIAYYNVRARLFSDDGLRVRSALGPRLFAAGEAQLEAALEKLRSDPASRRATIIVSDQTEVLIESRDQSCIESLHFFVRGGRLEAITTMRSQSALMVMPYDIALLLLVQLWAAHALGVPPGPHVWLAHSFHLYSDEVELATAVVEEPPTALRMPAIEAHADDLAFLQALEGAVRSAAVGVSLPSLMQLRTC
jgi:thymidylate synthase